MRASKKEMDLQMHRRLTDNFSHESDNGKLVDNFSNESDVTSLQNLFTSRRPYKTPSRHVPTRPLSIFTIVFPVKSLEAFSSNSMLNIAIFSTLCLCPL